MKKKICILVNSMGSGGAERVVSRIVNDLAASSDTQYKLFLVTLFEDNFYSINPNIERICLTKPKKFLFLNIRAIHFLRLLLSFSVTSRKLGFDVVQSHLYLANIINILSKFFFAGHIVQIVNTGAVSKFLSAGLLGKLKLRTICYLYKFADHVVYKSLGMKAEFEAYGLRNVRSNVINNPFDLDNISALSFDSNSGFEFASDKIYLISVGRFSDFKRQDVLISAMLALPDHFHLLLVGDGNNRAELEQIVFKFNLSTRVHFLGRQDNPFSLIRKCKLFILSSNDGEGFPNVLVEAMACGIPTISSDCRFGPREILDDNADYQSLLSNEVRHGIYGTLFPKGRSDCLSQAILSLVNNEKLYNYYVDASISRAQSFGLGAIIPLYKDILEIE